MDDGKLNLLAHHMSEARFEDAIKETTDAEQTIIYEDHSITKIPFYDDDIQYIETGLFENPIMVVCIITDI